MDKRVLLLAGSCALLGALAGCDKNTSSSAGASQTHFPGGVTSGGGTSGEVMARAGGTTSAPAAAAPQAGGESKRGQATLPGGSVSGTPSIPEGAGGTTSGPAMGGTTPGAAGTKAAPTPQEQQPEQKGKQ
ncbi:MAG TPA: hypothetical protein VJ698_00180 [Noviherbaspirillum sp.]|uniref:hypothetical protein n=1 Tax=Noviherbaspirillum sp. TaxID=1926288 RepID=UPI002B45CD4B|nr:hypothetical protein [Noviherbaspirillum sp.]HJV83861.1 hypothetical protein [Noviherbaspirillum sp.]